MKRVICFILMIVSCNTNTKKDPIKTNSFHQYPCDSVDVYGVMDSYKFYDIDTDSVALDFHYRIHKDTLFNITDKSKFFVDSVLVNKISKTLYLEKPKSYNDYDPPLPESLYPSLHVIFYKKDSIYEEKFFLIANDTLEYSNNFYRAVDFLYLYKIKNR